MENTYVRPLLSVDELASYIHKSVASIRSDATRNPQSLPPICRLPGTKRLLWRIEDVEQWLSQYVADSAYTLTSANQTQHPPTPKRGRPTKAEQVAKQRPHNKSAVKSSPSSPRK